MKSGTLFLNHTAEVIPSPQNNMWLVVTMLDSAIMQPHHCRRSIGQGWFRPETGKLPLKGQIAIIVGFVGHLKSVFTIQLCHSSTKAAIDGT